MPPTNDPLAGLHALPEEYQRAMREAFRIALFAQLDRLAAKASAEAAREAAKEDEVAA
jgi:hypothetical protein